MSQGPKPQEVQFQVQMDDEVANGQYINLAMVNHTETEFTLDFLYVQPQAPVARVRSRVITNPKHIKRLILALQDNLSKYEARFGPVTVPDEGPVH
jgi:hypothetical protein